MSVAKLIERNRAAYNQWERAILRARKKTMNDLPRLLACLSAATTALAQIEFNKGRGAEHQALRALADLDRIAGGE